MSRSQDRHKNSYGRLRKGLGNIWRYYRGWKWLIFIGLSFTLGLSSYLVLLAKTTNVSSLQEAMKSETTIYDYTDTAVGHLRNQKGTYVSLDQIAPTMRDTVVATEDKRFYEHNGFDALGIGRAVFRLILNRNTSGGGGSTLTQQLVKNAFLTQDRTIQRKLKEFFLALEVEKAYDKDIILEMYLNYAYFGNGVWGIEDASRKYFGHGANELTWNEAAVLTGMLKGPSIYNPIDDYEAAIDRRNVVIDLLESQAVIDSATASEIRMTGISLYDTYYYEDSYDYPAYFDAVIDEAVSRTQISEQDLMAKGYRIYTHLHTGYQAAIDQSYQADWLFPSQTGDSPLVQSASIVINPNNGGVMAIYGGRGEYVYRGFNRATTMKRSPGSTIKPLAVYTLALENGYQIHDMVPDVVKAYGSDHYSPENYDKLTDPSGQVQLYYALAQSKNTTAAYLMDQIGIEKAAQKLKQFGIQIAQEDKSLPLALGAFSQGVSPLQLANAYSAFANGGIRYDSSLIRRIEDASGRVVYQNERPDRSMVMTKKVAADMTSMMMDVFGGYGTGYGYGPDYGQIAGKTGSTEIGEGNMTTRDKWMVGYTPDFVVATWVGLDEISDQTDLDQLMPSGVGPLFRLQTTNLMANSPQTPFSVTYASQMTEDSNNDIDIGKAIEDLSQNEGWDQQINDILDQGGQWVGQTANDVWTWVSDGAGDLWQSASDWMSQLQLP